ncbi:hypothetical protein [Nannocystis pusilla]|uniref:hypothetical protein n=1 Tax=Nannocystis pusilla TaxID=889268 RepID=UPI003B7B4A7C
MEHVRAGPDRAHTYIAVYAEFEDGRREALPEAAQAQHGWGTTWAWQKTRVDIWRYYAVLNPDKPNNNRLWYLRSLCVREAMAREQPPRKIVAERVRRRFTPPDRVRAASRGSGRSSASRWRRSTARPGRCARCWQTRRLAMAEGAGSDGQGGELAAVGIAASTGMADATGSEGHGAEDRADVGARPADAGPFGEGLEARAGRNEAADGGGVARARSAAGPTTLAGGGDDCMAEGAGPDGHAAKDRRGRLARLRDALLTGEEDPAALGLLRIGLVAVFTASLLSHVGSVAEYFRARRRWPGSTRARRSRPAGRCSSRSTIRWRCRRSSPPGWWRICCGWWACSRGPRRC